MTKVTSCGDSVSSLYSVRVVSDHGAVGTLHLEELDDEGRASGDDLRWEVAEGAVLYAHDGQLTAECQLERQTVQVRVVVQVQVLQVLQCTCGLERERL